MRRVPCSASAVAVAPRRSSRATSSRAAVVSLRPGARRWARTRRWSVAQAVTRWTGLPAPPPRGARKRLAVERNDLPGKPHGAAQALRKGGREAAEDRLERLRVEQAEHAAEGVVARNAVAQPQQGAKQRLLGAPEQGHVAAGLGAAERCREGDDQHVHELVTGVAGARVGQLRKGTFQALQGKPPGSILDTSENPKRAALWSAPLQPDRLIADD